MSCFDAQLIRRITAIQLDECGRIPLPGDVAAPALKGLQPCVTSVGIEESLTFPTVTPVKAVDGSTCSKPKPGPTDLGSTYTLTFCGGNPVFESIIGFLTLVMDGPDIVGWRRNNITGSSFIALEIVFVPNTDACAGGEEPQCQALLVPMLESWTKTGTKTYDGNTTPDLVAAGTTRKSGSLFTNFATAPELPDFLSHWAPDFDEINSGLYWDHNRLIDCPAVDADADCCALVALDEAS